MVEGELICRQSIEALAGERPLVLVAAAGTRS
jgi:hypothetical protein